MPRDNVVFRPTVVIGLGGTGHGAILKLKRRFIDAYGSVPPIIRFLSIDTTENVDHSELADDGRAVTLDPGNERHVISVANPGQYVNGTFDHIEAWWPQNIPIQAINAGAGQVRARGRLALFARSREIFAAVNKAIDDVRQIKNQKLAYRDEFRVSDRGGVEVYIVSSLAGGTGSGTFLDMAFITRSFLDSLSNVTGVLVLPRVFKDLAGVALVKPNAYGALKEIERFFKMQPKDNFSIDYGTHVIDVTGPPFDLLYLMDSVNELGNVVKDTRDLLELISHGLYIQIGSQIGVDADNTVDNIKTHLSVAGTVRGRSANYCSFGVASLSLPVKEYETMKINDARRLLSDDLLNGVISDVDLETEVVRFISDNRLREDDADELIDALSEREGGGTLRFPMPLGQIKYDRTAAATLKQLRDTHVSRAERLIAQDIEANYKRIVDASVRAIDQWWEQAINRPNGLNYVQKFADKLNAKLEWYQRMMENEAKEENERLKSLNFDAYEEQVKQAANAFLGRANRIRSACENYKGMVDRQLDISLQATRRQKAAEVYGALRSHLEGKVVVPSARIRINLESTLKAFERLYLDITTNRGGENPFEQVVRFSAENNRPSLSGDDFFQWYRLTYGSVSLWADVRDENVQNQIMEYVRERYSPLAGQSIDDILRTSGSESISHDLKQLNSLAVPLWRYEEAKIGAKNVIDEFYYYGVEDASSTVLADAETQGKVPQGTTAPGLVSTLDPKRITLFKVKIGVPLFALQGIEEMERTYNDPEKRVSNHLHRDWESFPNLIPRAGDGEALRWFALAQAPDPFDLITRRGDWYYIRSQSAKRTDNGELKLGQGRLNAFRAFEKNRELIKEVEERVNILTRTKGQEEISRILREHSDRLQRQVTGGSIDTSIKEQVESELQSIEDYLQRLTRVH
jgi:Tubulin like